jgi:glycerol-3-phosphate O-acyltransferase
MRPAACSLLSCAECRFPPARQRDAAVAAACAIASRLSTYTVSIAVRYLRRRLTTATGPRVKYDEQIKAMRASRDAAHKKLQEMRAASESAWQHMQTGVDTAWASMKNALDKVSSQFKK